MRGSRSVVRLRAREYPLQRVTKLTKLTKPLSLLGWALVILLSEMTKLTKEAAAGAWNGVLMDRRTAA